MRTCKMLSPKPPKHARQWLAPLLLLLPALLAAAPVDVRETEEAFPVTDENGLNPRKMRLHQIRLENKYVRADFLPQLGGRLRSAFDKAAGQELFLIRPIEWTPTNYTAYGSQLGGHEVNFPCFHHGNNYRDQWNWHVDQESDGTAVMTTGWTDPLRRQRVVVRWSLHPHDAVLHVHYRFSNLNPRPMGFAPWANTFFGYADDLQYIIPATHVTSHGFNDTTLELWPWSWPDWDKSSLCFWRNLPPNYASFFAIGLQENFSGVYYTRADHGMTRLFDRAELPGIKVFTSPLAPELPTQRPGTHAYTEVWSSPVLSQEDMTGWEPYAVREYDEAYYGVHGIGSYRYANDAGAVNITRLTNTVEIGVCVTRPIHEAVIALSSTDGDWLRKRTDLSPEAPWRGVANRIPAREPLDLRVFDSDGNCVLHYAQRPDPGLRSLPQFTGSPMWQSSPQHAAIKAEQYHALWRGPTGAYGDYGAPGARAYRALLQKEPANIALALGLARSLLTDVQLRQPGQPHAGTAAAMTALAYRNLAEAATTLEPFAKEEPRAAVLLGEVRLAQGDLKAARFLFEEAKGDPVASVALSRLAAADGDKSLALQHSAAALRLLPGSPSVVQLHSANLIRARKRDDAKNLLQKLVAHDPVDALTFHLLSLADEKPADRKRWATRARTLLEQTTPPATLDADMDRLGWRPDAKTAE